VQKPSAFQALRTAAQLLFHRRVRLSFDQLDFVHNGSPFLKRLNFLIQGAQLVTRSTRRIGIPPILQLEPCNTCNLRCLTCATGARLVHRRAAAMPLGMFKNVIDQVRGSVYLLVFWSWGEPFLNRDAPKMIRYAKDSGLLVHASTNGHFFDSRDKAAAIVESGLDSLIIAVDGLDQQTYTKYRQGGDFAKVIASIEQVVAVRASLGTKHPRITFRFIVMKHNEHQVGEVRRFAESLGVDVLTFRSAVLRRSVLDLGDSLAPLAPEYRRFRYETDDSELGAQKRSRNYCHRPYANLTVFSNGDVVACENDFNAAVPLGNVTRNTVRQILSSATTRSFLKTFTGDLERFDFCRECENRHMDGHSANVQTIVLRESYGCAQSA
jgi:radical SAM protein with 4Fe4S-binding SPASM domain